MNSTIDQTVFANILSSVAKVESDRVNKVVKDMDLRVFTDFQPDIPDQVKQLSSNDVADLLSKSLEMSRDDIAQFLNKSKYVVYQMPKKKDVDVDEQLSTNRILCASTDKLNHKANSWKNGCLVYNTDLMKMQIFYEGRFIDI